MSERSNISASGGPRQNPLYGGPANAGNRTPSWAKKSSPPGRGSQSAFSDVASSPPDSPVRSGRSNYGPSYYAPQYENPGYTVETPGHQFHDPSASPYRPPAYFVQTPQHSERAGLIDTPMSSAPSSPPHFGPNGTPGYSETRSHRSSRSMKSGRTATGKTITKIDEEEEYFPDLERDAARKRRFWKCCMAWSFVLAIIAIVATATTLIIVFEPSSPTYYFNGANVNGFQVVSGTDSNGLPTEQLYANITLRFYVSNPNSHYEAEVDGGMVKLGYSSIQVMMQQEFRKLTVGKKKGQNFTSSLSTMAFPMYGAGPTLRADVAEKIVPIAVTANIKSHVSVLWKLIESQYTHKMNCIMNIDPFRMKYINDTCNASKKSKAASAPVPPS